MSGFGILMGIFAVCVFLSGLYMFTGHKLGIMTLRPGFKNLKKDGWKNIGKWTMVVSLFIMVLAILGFVFNFE